MCRREIAKSITGFDTLGECALQVVPCVTPRSASVRLSDKLRHLPNRPPWCDNSFPPSLAVSFRPRNMLARCLRSGSGDISWDVEQAVRARIESQAALLDEARTFTFMLTEQAIRWPRADLDVMARQCVHMPNFFGPPHCQPVSYPQSRENFSFPSAFLRHL